MPFVVRPKAVFGTPKKITKELREKNPRWKLRFYPNPQKPDRRFDYRRDFLMFPVSPDHVEGFPEAFVNSVNFAHKNKLHQRKELEQYVPVPKVSGSHAEAETLQGDQFVVRPLRHFGGMGYRVTSNRLDFSPGTEYISELFPKRREYRVIFLFGKPLIFMRKKPNDNVTEEAPWGHQNSFFQTINDIPGCRLSETDCVPRLSSCPAVSGAHIVAADILYNKNSEGKYSVLELNFCPGLDIDNNRARVVEGILNRV
jgi:hypothetical protein